jgi:16S rRNA (adenine1518-N6/adenine1519-N6)-dimethyltransferase
MPAPNVDSAVIRLDLYDNPPFTAKNEKHFFKFIRECFTQRRKTLVNNLCSNNYDKDKVKEMLSKLNIKESVRSEELSIEDFVLMSDFLEGEN